MYKQYTNYDSNISVSIDKKVDRNARYNYKSGEKDTPDSVILEIGHSFFVTTAI